MHGLLRSGGLAAAGTRTSRHAAIVALLLLSGLLAAPASRADDADAAPPAKDGAATTGKTRKAKARLEVTGPGNSVNPADPALYVGAQECLSCHEDEGHFDIRRTAHLSLFIPGKQPAHLSGCEGCHGPGAAHAAKGSPSKIRRFATLDPGERSLACLQCHAGSDKRSQYRRSAHDLNQVACDSCHQAHAPAPESWNEKCQTCHPEVQAEFGQPFRHDPEGSVGCTDCHAQHGSAGRQVKLHDTDEICSSCHAEQAGPFAFEHLPRLFGGCTSCHAPHGSPNPRQLVRHDVNETCLTCHVNTPDSHDQSDGVHDTCVTCHARIHGSNVDPAFRE